MAPEISSRRSDMSRTAEVGRVEEDVEEDRGTRPVGRRKLGDTKTWSRRSSTEEHQGRRVDVVTAGILLAVEVQPNCTNGIDGLAAEDALISSLKMLRKTLV